MAKIIFSGAEDSGKSLMLAEYAGKIVERNGRWLSQGLPARPIRSNLEFQPWFEEYAASKGVPIVYWKDIEEWVNFRECDMICDEVGAYLDSRTYQNLPIDIRLWLAQASKLGVDIYGSAQDFAQIDISFRRLIKGPTNALYQITKLIGSPRPAATRPPVRRIWGVCTMKELDPVAYDEGKQRFTSKSWLPGFFAIRREICSIFDTQKRIAKSKPPPYKHIERECTDADCKFQMHKVIDGRTLKITHV